MARPVAATIVTTVHVAATLAGTVSSASPTVKASTVHLTPTLRSSQLSTSFQVFSPTSSVTAPASVTVTVSLTSEVSTDKCANSSSNNCSEHAWCETTQNNCVCKNGFSGNGVNCTDINECRSRGACHQHATCNNTIGSYNCTCNKGFSGDGDQCTDIDECLANSPCREDQECQNYEGFHVCRCPPGFFEKENSCKEAVVFEASLSIEGGKYSEFTRQLEDKTSNEFKELSGVVCSQIDKVYANSSIGKEYLGCEVIRFLNGSVQADTAVNFRSQSNVTVSDAGQVMEDTLAVYSTLGPLVLNKTTSVVNDLDECSDGSLNDCHKHAFCNNTVGSFECHCKTGFNGNGKLCTDIDECSNSSLNNCTNNVGVVCRNYPEHYRCECKRGYTGDGFTCSDINECSNSSLNNCTGNPGVECINYSGGYNCTCSTGYVGDGVTCIKVPVNECLNSSLNNCSVYAQCRDKRHGFTCECKTGFTGDGFNCTDINECRSRGACHQYATCNNTLGSYLCSCNKGFSGDGDLCADIDECLAKSSCREDQRCHNYEGSHECSCHPGFFDYNNSCKAVKVYEASLKIIGGKYAQYKGTLQDRGSTDFRELAKIVCTEIDAIYRRSHLLSSYFGCSIIRFLNGSIWTDASINIDGRSNVTIETVLQVLNSSVASNRTLGPLIIKESSVSVSDYNECSSSATNNCHAHSYCINTQGSFQCLCKPGFAGNGVICKDIDECSSSSLHNCTNNAGAVCENTIGGFRCVCENGFAGNGTTCVVTNMCAARRDNCHVNATCYPTSGETFKCECKHALGYYGNGTYCFAGCPPGLCQNGAECFASDEGNFCKCPKGFHGDLCEKEEVTELNTEESKKEKDMLFIIIVLGVVAGLLLIVTVVAVVCLRRRTVVYANEIATDVGEIENIVNYGISPGIQHYHNISSRGRSGYHPEADMLGNVSEDSTFQLPPKRLRARTPLKDRADRNANVSGAASQAVAGLSQVDLALGRSPSSPVDEQRADAVFDDQLAFDDLLEARYPGPSSGTQL